MRPLKLQLQGLNSFVERQVIDFETLTARGLFGIFGPTGSGKSSILDGITLALYGRIARGSTEFINKQVDTLSVVYEFSLTTNETVYYKVERELKRNKQGETRTSYAKLTRMGPGPEVVLEEKAASVTKRCEEIIGLGVEDFSRTVVLPQGKFSEFLKLPNGPRREMLERIFNLESYGAALSAKVSRALAEVKTALSELNGQLSGYDGVSEGELSALQLRLSEEEQALTAETQQLGLVEAAFAKAKGQFELGQRLEEAKAQLTAHSAKAAECSDFEAALSADQAAAALKPHWERLEQHEAQLSTLSEKLQAFAQGAKASEEALAGLNIAFEALVARQRDEVPHMQGQLSLLKEGLKEIEQLMMNKRAIDGLKKELLPLVESEETSKLALAEGDQRLKALQGELKGKEGEQAKLQMPESLKQDLRQWASTKEKLEALNQRWTRQSDERMALDRRRLDDQKRWEETRLAVTTLEAELVRIQQGLTEAQRQHQADQASRLDFSLEVERIKQTASQQQEAMEKLQGLQERLTTQTQALALSQEAFEEAQVAHDALRLAYEAEEKAYWQQHFIEACMASGTCPICGSRDLTPQMGQDINPARSHSSLSKADLSAAAETLDRCKARLLGDQVQLAQVQSELAAIDVTAELQTQTQLGLSEATKQLEALSQRIEAGAQTQRRLEQDLTVKTKALQALMSERDGLAASLKLLGEQLEKAKVESEQFEAEKAQLEMALRSGQALLTQMPDFNSNESSDVVLKRLHEREQVAEALASQMAELRRQVEALSAKGEGLRAEHQRLSADLAQKKGIIDGKIEAYQTQKTNLQEKLGDLMQVKSRHDALSAELEIFYSNYKQMEDKLKAGQLEAKTASEAYVKAQAAVIETQNLCQSAAAHLAELLAVSPFNHVDEAKAKYLDPETRESQRQWVNAYQKTLSELSGAIKSLTDQLGDAPVSASAYGEITDAYEAQKQKTEALKTRVTQLQMAFGQMQEKLLAMGELLGQREAISLKMARLQDLSKLFEARKFVAFIAASQLSYVAGKASEQLLEMTQGAYSLETEADGSFLIRDFKNGGVTRDVATLSGGETFLVSLALALSLSAQIQLKGKAPLELFFLDEGFGTLDEDTLEVVMSALESLHHDRLAIGLISHVEAIKNRVPIKLVVEPAKAGLGGTKVKIELS